MSFIQQTEVTRKEMVVLDAEADRRSLHGSERAGLRTHMISWMMAKERGVASRMGTPNIADCRCPVCLLFKEPKLRFSQTTHAQADTGGFAQ